MAVRDKVITKNNETYFITFTILDWRHVFINDKYCSLVYQWFNYVKRFYDNKLYSYVIMPNHIHCIMKLSEKSPDVSKLIQNAKRFLAYEIIKQLKKDNNIKLLNYFSKTNNNGYTIFEPRFDSLVLYSRRVFLQKLNYIHRNPCQEKWQLAFNPEDYKYSSASNYILNKGCYEIDIFDI